MPICRNCGEEISQEQYNLFKGLCPACKRIQPIAKGSEFDKWCTIIAVVGTLIGGSLC